MSDQPFLQDLLAEGVSPWLDALHLELLDAGELWHGVQHANIRGAVTEPTALASAVAHGPRYREALTGLALRGASATEALRALCATAARWACDELFTTHTLTDGRDGLASTLIDPPSPHDPGHVVAAARDAAARVNRPNVLILLPPSPGGCEALRHCTAAGISTHVTGVCSPDLLDAVQEAYLAGLEEARRARVPLHTVVSVAAVPVGRIGAAAPLRTGAGTGSRDLALAVARLAYHHYDSGLGDPRWARLADAGARPQRLVWTGSPPEAVDDFVAPQTVSALTPATLRALPAHRDPRGDTLSGRRADAERVLRRPHGDGAGYADVVGHLQSDLLEQYESALHALHATVERELGAARKRLR